MSKNNELKSSIITIDENIRFDAKYVTFWKKEGTNIYLTIIGITTPIVLESNKEQVDATFSRICEVIENAKKFKN